MKENIIKKVCNRLNITQKELWIRLDVSLSTIARWSWDTSNMPKNAIYTLNLLLDNFELNSKLNTIQKAHNIIKNL